MMSLIDNITDNPMEEINSSPINSRISGKTSGNNGSYTDTFETSTFETSTFETLKFEPSSKDIDGSTELLEDEVCSSGRNDIIKNDSSLYTDTFESSESFSTSLKESFQQDGQSDKKWSETESSDSCSGFLNRKTIFDASEFSLFQDLPDELDNISSTHLETFSRLTRETTEIKSKTEQDVELELSKEEREKEIFIKKCIQHIQEPTKKTPHKPKNLEFDYPLKQFVDTVMMNLSKSSPNCQELSKNEKMSKRTRSEMMKENFLKSSYQAPASFLAKIKMKNLLETMDEACTARIHSTKKCCKCNPHRKRVEASVARKTFIRAKVNDLTRKKTELKFEEHLVKMASLCLQEKSTSAQTKEEFK